MERLSRKMAKGNRGDKTLTLIFIIYGQRPVNRQDKQEAGSFCVAAIQFYRAV